MMCEQKHWLNAAFSFFPPWRHSLRSLFLNTRRMPTQPVFFIINSLMMFCKLKRKDALLIPNVDQYQLNIWNRLTRFLYILFANRLIQNTSNAFTLGHHNSTGSFHCLLWHVFKNVFIKIYMMKPFLYEF